MRLFPKRSKQKWPKLITSEPKPVIALFQYGRTEKDKNPFYINWHHDWLTNVLPKTSPRFRRAIVDALRSAADDFENGKVDKYDPDIPINSDPWPWDE